ncbi:LacI family DNA-binding transcriptional regulator [Vagococcus fluvialis]|uniref:LacI family DNA-binding transcriptional regulator n=1 Tax=Vagococcus fluvialis TaxID=2738 RepID=UPI003B5B474B
MTTIKDIAKYTGVSPTTVSNVIHGRDEKVSPETKDKVNKALKELNYTANMGGRLLAKHGSKIIGMIIQDTEAEQEEFYDNPYYGELIQAVESQVKKHGYFMMFHRVADFEEGARLAQMWHLESLIVSGASSSDVPKWEERVSVPIVFVDTYGIEKEQPKLNVGIEDTKGAYELTDYLLNRNHQNILFLAKGENSESWVGADFKRAQGVKQAMENRGLTPVFLSMPTTYKNYQPFVHQELIPKLTDVTAIFCASDLLAVQIISELYQKGIKVPEDISIVSFDGTLLSRYATPKITSMSQDITLKAKAVVELAVEGILEGPQLIKKVVLETKLTEGESVKLIND